MGNFHSKKPTKTQIPDDIIEEILHKLPIKSLVRFTCVSKSWFSLLKSPSFISDHLTKNPLFLVRYVTKPNENPTSDYTTDNYSLFFADDQQEEYHQYKHYYVPFETHYNYSCFFFIVVGTINGLVCLDSNPRNIIIWNPSIKRSIIPPEPSITCYYIYSLGFGYDANSNDYKVLRIANRPVVSYEFPAEDRLEAEIYSLNMNSWKRIDVPRAGYLVKGQEETMVFVHGKLHLLVYREVGEEDHWSSVLVLGVDDEVFHGMELPQSVVYDNPFALRLFKYKESIALLQQDWPGTPGPGGPGPGAYVWVMEKYGVVESWIKIVSFNREEGNWPSVFGYDFDDKAGNWPYVFGSCKNGELFMQMTKYEMVSFEPNIQVIKRLGVSGVLGFVDYFVESLELLDNANAQSDPSVQNDAAGDAAADDAVGDAAAHDASLMHYVPLVLFASLGVLTLWRVWNRRV